MKPFAPSVDDGVVKHWQNFVSVVKSRNKSELHCPIQAGAHVATVAQMGNIAYRSGQKLAWDESKAQFADKDINEKYFMKPYHNGYELPKI